MAGPAPHGATLLDEQPGAIIGCQPPVDMWNGALAAAAWLYAMVVSHSEGLSQQKRTASRPHVAGEQLEDSGAAGAASLVRRFNSLPRDLGRNPDVAGRLSYRSLHLSLRSRCLLTLSASRLASSSCCVFTLPLKHHRPASFTRSPNRMRKTSRRCYHKATASVARNNMSAGTVRANQNARPSRRTVNILRPRYASLS